MPTIEWNRRWGKDLALFIDKAKTHDYYGCGWGDPDVSGLRYWVQRIILRTIAPGDLSKVVKQYIKPYVTPESVVLEIGPGGGRWAKHLLAAKEIILVELNPEFFHYLEQRFDEHLSKFRFYHTSGYELDGIETDYVDFIFTFGTFVHIDPDGIYSYLGHIERVLRPNGIAVVQYADKTKKRGRQECFSDMNPSKMEAFASDYGFRFLDHNTHLLNHSSIAVIQKCK